MARGTLRYNAPPTWPPPPAGWVPPRGWAPDPTWPPPPAGWEFWLPIDGQSNGATPRSVLVRVVAAVLLTSVLVLAASAGATTYMVTLGLVAVVLGVVATIAGRSRSWLTDRRAGIAALVLGLVCLVIAGAFTRPMPAAAPVALPHVLPLVSPGPPSTPSPSSQPPTAATPTPPASVTPTPRATPTATPTPKPKPGTALAATAALAVKGRAPKTGYDRDNFGSAWTDVDRNGCDTRNDMLRRDLDPVTVRAGTQGCLVVSGTLSDPYTATMIAFTRGQSTSTAVQIDHVVALSDGWQKGAQAWSATKREAFANDPLNLLAVQGSANMSKGDGDTATWLPSNKAMRCMYVGRQVSVKAKYGLWVTGAEQDAMERVLRTCPDRLLTTDKDALLRKAISATIASVPWAPQPPPDPGPAPSGTAIAAGYGPYSRGQDSEYDWYRDGDSDGKVCEH